MPSRTLNVLEVGSWTGSSALSIAQAVRAFNPLGGVLTCVDSWEPYFSDADISKGEPYGSMDSLLRLDLPYNLFRHNTQTIGGDIGLKISRGKSAQILPNLTPGSFDLIYIDGSHYYDDVLNDLRCSNRLLRDGGILCGDDLELQYGNFDVKSALSHVHEDYVTDPKSSTLYHPGVSLATSEFFGRAITVATGFWAAQKRASKYEDVVFVGARSIVPAHFPELIKVECRAMLEGVQYDVGRIIHDGHPDTRDMQ